MDEEARGEGFPPPLYTGRGRRSGGDGEGEPEDVGPSGERRLRRGLG